MSQLFAPIQLRSLTAHNRIFVSPMCMYAAVDGHVNDWHLVHLGGLAVGGAGLVMAEATAVLPQGRISPGDAGLWSDAHVAEWQRVTRFVRQHGAIAAVQLAHAGRKASTAAPWQGGKPVPTADGGWQTVAPSPVAFGGYPAPRALTLAEIDGVVDAFAAAAGRAHAAGFQCVEIHAAHGYLLHQFLSPLANFRTDAYGGSQENRFRLPLRVAQAVRAAFPAELPVFVRISATDWQDGGWDLDGSIALCRQLRALGVDLIDVSSGALVHDAKIPAGPGFQVPFAAAIRAQADIATGAVGLITAPAQAEQILATGQADVVFLARELLRDPHWPLRAARVLGDDVAWPNPYARAKI